jgi:Mrp family chromosome partitioning ATPase
MLVDGDLRRPRVTEMIGSAKGDGFVKVLAGQSRLGEAATSQRFHADQKRSWRRGRKPLVTVQGDVAVLPAGRTSTAPQRLINEQSAQVLLEQAREEGRDTVIDGPPLGLFGDMLPLARRVDGVLVVVRLYHTTKRSVRSLLRQLETAGVQPRGVVVIGTGEQSDKMYGA